MSAGVTLFPPLDGSPLTGRAIRPYGEQNGLRASQLGVMVSTFALIPERLGVFRKPRGIARG